MGKAESSALFKPAKDYYGHVIDLNYTQQYYYEPDENNDD